MLLCSCALVLCDCDLLCDLRLLCALCSLCLHESRRFNVCMYTDIMGFMQVSLLNQFPGLASYPGVISPPSRPPLHPAPRHSALSTGLLSIRQEHKSTTMVSSILLSRLTPLFIPPFFSSLKKIYINQPPALVRQGLHDGSEAPTRATSLESGRP